MEILTLLPILLKVLPFAVIGILYALWRGAAYSRDKAKERAAAAEASYELAGEVAEIDKEGKKDAEAIENLDLSGVVDALRGRVRDSGKG